MKFRTELKPLKQLGSISHHSSILSIGSCFANSIGDKLNLNGFNVNVNPFGILFNPVSILNLLKGCDLEPEHLLDQASGTVSYDFHSKVTSPSKNEFITQFNEARIGVENELKHNDLLILTFGTAWAYQYKSTGKIIANCQKQRADLFEKTSLDLETLKVDYTHTLNQLFEENKKLKIILTVSPVRHIKDGLIENNRSKSILILLCSHLAVHFPNRVIYYPSYEIITDDLRDYRFYRSDLIHPNEMAIDYVYDHFKQSFFDQVTVDNSKLFEQYNRLKGHRFLNASEDEILAHNDKLNALEAKLEEIKKAKT